MLTVVSCLCVSVCCSLFSRSYIIMASEYVSSMTVGLLSILEQFCESKQYVRLTGRRFSKQNEISVLAYNQLDFHRECLNGSRNYICLNNKIPVLHIKMFITIVS